MCVAAMVAIAAATAIPQVIKAIIDGPVTHRQTADLPLYAGLVVALALMEAAGDASPFLCQKGFAEYLRRNYGLPEGATDYWRAYEDFHEISCARLRAGSARPPYLGSVDRKSCRSTEIPTLATFLKRSAGS